MNTSFTAWQRLLRSARQAPETFGDLSAPYGFSSRVVALAWMPEVPVTALFDRLSWRALGVAGVVMAVSVAANVMPALNAFNDDTLSSLPDPVAEIVALN